MIELVKQPFNCVHCGKNFMKEVTLVAHMCERKRRSMQRDEKRVQTGFLIYDRFYKLTQNSKKPKTYEDFCASSYYNAFVKFGSFINNVNPLYPDKFIDYVIKSGVKLDHWCREALYEKYLYEVLKTEPVESAMERSLATMMDWAEKNKAAFGDYFRFVSLNRAVHDIKSGHISPWAVFNSLSGQDMMNRMNDEQLEMISPAIDPAHWLGKIKSSPADVALVKEICREAGIK
jgi:hypothetical protein